MIKKFSLLTSVSIGLLTLFSPNLYAQEKSNAKPVTKQAVKERDTLEKIKRTGTIIMAVRENAVPFSYFDEKGNTIGYTVEICESVAKTLRKNLEISKLKVVYMPVQAAERMDVVKNGLADMECGVTTNTKARQANVDFSVGIFAVETRFLAPKTVTLGPVEDLAGKMIATTANSIGEAYVNNQKESKNLKFTVNQYKDNKESMLTILDGVNQVHPNDDILLYSQIAFNDRMKEKLHVTGTPFSPNTYGIVLPKHDPKFKLAVDSAVKEMMASGKINAIYEKWFLKPVPPKNININVPMNETTKKIFANPTDEAFLEK